MARRQIVRLAGDAAAKAMWGHEEDPAREAYIDKPRVAQKVVQAVEGAIAADILRAVVQDALMRGDIDKQAVSFILGWVERIEGQSGSLVLKETVPDLLRRLEESYGRVEST